MIPQPQPQPQPQPLWVCIFLLAACGHPDRGTTPAPPNTPDAATAEPTIDAAPPAKVLQLNQTGELIDIEQSFVPGHVVYFDVSVALDTDPSAPVATDAADGSVSNAASGRL